MRIAPYSSKVEILYGLRASGPVSSRTSHHSRAGARGGRVRDHTSVRYLTPASSPVREQPSELDGVSATGVAVAAASTTNLYLGALYGNLR